MFRKTKRKIIVKKENAGEREKGRKIRRRIRRRQIILPASVLVRNINNFV